MNTVVLDNKYRKISLTALIAGILAVSFCIIYIFSWELFDAFLTSFIAHHRFIPYLMFLYVTIGTALAVTAVIAGSVDLRKISTGIYSEKGKLLAVTGLTLGSILILLGLVFWFVDFFGLINIIT